MCSTGIIQQGNKFKSATPAVNELQLTAVLKPLHYCDQLIILREHFVVRTKCLVSNFFGNFFGRTPWIRPHYKDVVVVIVTGFHCIISWNAEMFSLRSGLNFYEYLHDLVNWQVVHFLFQCYTKSLKNSRKHGSCNSIFSPKVLMLVFSSRDYSITVAKIINFHWVLWNGSIIFVDNVLVNT